MVKKSLKLVNARISMIFCVSLVSVPMCGNSVTLSVLVWKDIQTHGAELFGLSVDCKITEENDKHVRLARLVSLPRHQ